MRKNKLSMSSSLSSDEVSTGSGPGSPRGQPAWGGGTDRVRGQRVPGSTSSAYMLTTADRMFRAGFNVLRVNYRNCGGTEHLSPTLYHGGLTGDLRGVIDELISRDRLTQLFVAGFSLGGNMVLKLAGEYGEDPPAEVKAICAVSPSIDLRASTSLIARPRKWLYQHDFLRRLK